MDLIILNNSKDYNKMIFEMSNLRNLIKNIKFMYL